MHALPALGQLIGQEHHFAVRVYFEDTDLSGVVYHANYLRFMERARSDMLLAAGVDQRAVHEAGEGAYAIRDLSIRYRAPARLGDELIIVSRMTALRAAAVDIHQRVMHGEIILAEAQLEVAFMSPEGRARRQPAEWRAAFEPLIYKGN